MFISFEGIDKSGKSTQVALLFSYLKKKGYPVIRTCEPGGTSIGKEIKKILLFPKRKIDRLTELFLYLADRSSHVKEVIKPALKEGKIVISDRFADATIAYQGYGRGLDINWIEELNRIATGGCESSFVYGTCPAKGPDRERRDRISPEGKGGILKNS